MEDSLLKRTPLNTVHRASGAKMVDFGGWDMPVQYSGLVDEHNTVRRAVGLFDVSHMGEIEISGPEAHQLTEYVTTNNAAKLNVGQAHYSGLLYKHGGFVDDILVHKVADDFFFICVNASNQEKDYEHILAAQQAKGFDAAVNFASDQYAQIAVQGPRALETLQKITPAELSQIKYYWFEEGPVAGIPARIAHTGYTGEDGFELYVEPVQAPHVWHALLEAGKEFGIKPCGLGARNTLRLEAKMALYGHEIHASISPLEADLSWIVKFDKGDFIGRDALLKQRESGLTRKLVGFEMTSRGIGRDGYEVSVDSIPGGWVTSGSPSPTVGKNIGLCYLPVSQTQPGQPIQVTVRNQPVDAVVVPTPFYKRPK